MYPESCPPLKSMGIRRKIARNFESLKSFLLIAYAYMLMIRSPSSVPVTVTKIVTA